MNIDKEASLKQWADDMARQKASGLSQKEWCIQNGISHETFRYHCRKVRRASGETGITEKETACLQIKEPPLFAKVSLKTSQEVLSGIRIHCHDTVVNIAPDTPDSHVQMVLEVLRHA